MREIKFRILAQTKGVHLAFKWLYFSTGDATPWNWQVVPESETQYTGLKDKNGMEIYEGDVVHVKFSTAWAKHSSYEEVSYDKGAFTAGGYKITRRGLEVIGNIYENPELLTQGD